MFDDLHKFKDLTDCILRFDFDKDRHKLHVKILDYGLATILNDDEEAAFSYVGTPRYCAPEVLFLKNK